MESGLYCPAMGSCDMAKSGQVTRGKVLADAQVVHEFQYWKPLSHRGYGALEMWPV